MACVFVFYISVGHPRTFISWESEAESDLAPPELGFSFFLFCFFFFLLAPKSPPGLLQICTQAHSTSLNGGEGGWRRLTRARLSTHSPSSGELTLATIATNDSWANVSRALARKLTVGCHHVIQSVARSLTVYIRTWSQTRLQTTNTTTPHRCFSRGYQRETMGFVANSFSRLTLANCASHRRAEHTHAQRHALKQGAHKQAEITLLRCRTGQAALTLAYAHSPPRCPRLSRRYPGRPAPGSADWPRIHCPPPS